MAIAFTLVSIPARERILFVAIAADLYIVSKAAGRGKVALVQAFTGKKWRAFLNSAISRSVHSLVN
jgi:hypothetical protein